MMKYIRWEFFALITMAIVVACYSTFLATMIVSTALVLVFCILETLDD